MTSDQYLGLLAIIAIGFIAVSSLLWHICELLEGKR